MKKITFLLLLVLIVSSCKKQKEITYPTNTILGENVLTLETVLAGNEYSFAAKLGKKAALTIVLTNLSPEPASGEMKPVWFYGEEQGWTVSEYSSDSQTFISNKSGDIDLSFLFSGSPGSCRIDFYENTKKVTKTKTLT